MLVKPSPQVLSALASLEGDSDFTTVMVWLKDSLSSLHAANTDTRDEVQMRWKQGAAQALMDLLQKAESAKAVIRKSR